MNSKQLLLSLGLAMAIVPARAEDILKRPMQPDGRLVLEARSGDFVISGSRDEQLRIESDPTSANTELSLSGDAAHWTLLVERSETMSEAPGRAAHHITLPESAEIEVRVADGEVLLEGINSRRVQLQSAAGPIRLLGSQVQRLVVETASGSIRGEALSVGEARLSSIDGWVDVVGQFERLAVQTLSGSVELLVDGLIDLDLETLSGDMVAVLRPAEDAVLRARSQAGLMRLRLPEGTALDLHAESHRGTISSDFGGEPERGQGSNQRWIHRSGRGHVRAELRSVDSAIELQSIRPMARVLVFHEPVQVTASRAVVQRRHARRVHFGIDDEEKLALREGQFAELDLPLDSRMVFARQPGVPKPVELEVVRLEETLYCFRIARAEQWAGTPDLPTRQVGFELTHVQCPELETLAEFERVEVTP